MTPFLICRVCGGRPFQNAMSGARSKPWSAPQTNPRVHTVKTSSSAKMSGSARCSCCSWWLSPRGGQSPKSEQTPFFRYKRIETTTYATANNMPLTAPNRKPKHTANRRGEERFSDRTVGMVELIRYPAVPISSDAKSAHPRTQPMSLATLLRRSLASRCRQTVSPRTEPHQKPNRIPAQRVS